MKSLVTAIALAVCASGAYAAGAYISDGRGNTVDARSGSASVSSSIDSNSSSTITNNSVVTNNSTITSDSTNTGTTITNSTDNSQSSCSTSNNGRSCEVSCLAPQVAQCVKPTYRRAPSCYCQ